MDGNMVIFYFHHINKNRLKFLFFV